MHLIYMHTGPPEQPRVSVDVRQGELVFSWQPNIPICSLVEYNIISNKCGSCICEGTSATCSNLTLSTIAAVCSFSVSSMACGFSGTPSDPIDITVKGMYVSEPSLDDPLYQVNDYFLLYTVPDIPMIQALLPVYSDVQVLTGIAINISQEVS